MSAEEINTLLTWFSIVTGAISIISFVFNLYQHYKIKNLRDAIDSIDRMSKSAKMECAKIENETGNKQVRTVAAIISSILNVTTTFMGYKHKDFDGKSNSVPFISVD